MRARTCVDVRARVYEQRLIAQLPTGAPKSPGGQCRATLRTLTRSRSSGQGGGSGSTPWILQTCTQGVLCMAAWPSRRGSGLCVHLSWRGAWPRLARLAFARSARRSLQRRGPWHGLGARGASAGCKHERFPRGACCARKQPPHPPGQRDVTICVWKSALCSLKSGSYARYFLMAARFGFERPTANYFAQFGVYDLTI